MQFKRNASVVNAGGHKVGEVDRVVLDPKNGEISHLVVKKGFLLPVDKVLPVDMIDSSDDDRVRLKEGLDKLDSLPDFYESEYISADPTQRQEHQYPADSALPMYYYPTVGGVSPTFGGIGPWGMTTPPLGPVLPTEQTTEENIPDNYVALQAGAQVIDPLGEKVGSVEKIITRPDNDEITHMVISKGGFDKTKKLIPASWIKAIKEDQVQLGVSAMVVDQLKEYNE